MSLPISEVEVVGRRIVEVNGPFHQAQPQQTAVEIQVLLRVARKGGNVMDAQELLHLP